MSSVEGSKSSFMCKWNGCGRSYGLLKNLRHHQRLKGHDESETGKLLCPVVQCSRRFPFMASLCGHVKDDHKMMEAAIEVKSFLNFKEFSDWKHRVETGTCSRYVQHESAKTWKSGKLFYFYCHRSGQKCKNGKVKKKRVRTVKSPGLCKIMATCTAHMSVSVDAVTGKVTCKYCKFHVGHDLDIGHNEGSTVETVDTQQVDIRIDDDKMVIESIVADCQQIMSMVAPGGFSKTVLLAVKKHVSAAKARVQKASLRKPVELGVTHKQPSTEKHDKLLGVRSLPVKRGPLTTGSRMLNAAEVTAVEQLLLARRGADGDTSATDRPSDGLGCSMLE